MTMHVIDIDEPLARFVEDRVSSGSYQDAAEVVRAGLGLLKDRADRDAKKVERLRAAIQVGLDEIERGEVEVVEDLEAWFDGIEADIDRR